MSMHSEIDLISADTDIPTAGNRYEKRLNNRYLLGAKIGTGGLCAVYEAKDDYSEYFGDQRSLAVKIPLEYLSGKSDIDAFMYAEYAHLSRLSHPHIVKAVDFGIDADLNIPYLVLEQLQGRLLSEIPFSNISDGLKSSIFHSLWNILDYVHEQQIVHADINPTNIMCLDDGSIRLFDFGISLNTGKKQTFELDYSTIKAYNPRYAAPEIINGSFPTKESDIFSIAVVCYELYCGKLPYVENSTEFYDSPISSSEIKLLPFFLRNWFRNALSVSPSKRPLAFPSYLNLKKHLVQNNNIFSCI